MRAWLESVLLTAASFGCQAIYRRRMSRTKKVWELLLLLFILTFIIFFFFPSLRIVSKRSENGKFMASNLSSVHSDMERERVRDEEEVNTFRYLLQVTIGRHDTLINYLCHTLWNCYVESLDEKWKKKIIYCRRLRWILMECSLRGWFDVIDSTFFILNW